MKRSRKLVGLTIVFLFAVLVAGPVWAAFPQPQGFVNDFANVLDRRSQSELQVLAEQLRGPGVELAVVTVASTDPLDPKEYTTGLFNEWGSAVLKTAACSSSWPWRSGPLRWSLVTA